MSIAKARSKLATQARFAARASMAIALLSIGCNGSESTAPACAPGKKEEAGECVPEKGDASAADAKQTEAGTPEPDGRSTDGTLSTPDGGGMPDRDARDELIIEPDVPDASIVNPDASDSVGPSVDAADSGSRDAAIGDSLATDAPDAMDSTNAGDAPSGDANPGDGASGDSSKGDAGIGDSSTIDVREAGIFDGWAPPNCTADAGVTAADGGSRTIIIGHLSEIVIDPCNQHIYLSNTTFNQIEDYSVATHTLAAPIAVGSQPQGLDITPDNRRLYVANTGETTISVVDLVAHQELNKIAVPLQNSQQAIPLSLAIASNGQALVSTTFSGSGFGGYILSLDLTNEILSRRNDCCINGRVTEATFVKASSDRTAIAAVLGDVSNGPMYMYHTASNTFSPEHVVGTFASRPTLNSNGTIVLVDARVVLDGSLNPLGTVPGAAKPWAAFAPSGNVAYRAAVGAIEIMNLSQFMVTGSIPMTADTIDVGTGSRSGNLVVSSDGKWAAVITDHGLTFVNLP